MKKIILFLCNIVAALFTNAQSPTFQWAKQMGGGLADQAYAVSLDAMGNVYTAGTFFGTADFDPGVGTFTLTSLGSNDIFISKLDATGNFIWAKQLGGTLSDAATSMTVDANGNVYTTGNFRGTVDFDPGVGITNLNSSGGTDAFISKLNTSGNFVWAKNIGGASNDGGNSITTDPYGNVCSTGFFAGTADFDPGVSFYNLTASGSNDSFVSKLDTAGNFVWATQLGGILTDQGNGVATDALGNVYSTGYFNGTGDFDPGVGTFTLTSLGSNDIFISKLDASGNFIWAKQLGGTLSDISNAITIDAVGNVYTTGYLTGTADFDPGAGTYTLTAAGSIDIFISKLDAGGNFVWARNTGGNFGDSGLSIDIDALGNVYTTGYFQGTADFDPGAGTVNLISSGNTDIFISKLDVTGNFVWAEALGGTLSDSGNGVTTDALGNIYTTGYFNVAVDFDPAAGIVYLTSLGANDIFVHKMSPCAAALAPVNVTPITNQNICVGNISTLSASATGTISWFATPTSTLVLGTGTTLVTPTLSIGTYTYYAEAMICLPSATRTAITITVNALPTILASTGNTLICAGQTVTLTASGATTYSWNPGGAGTSIVVTPTATANYTVYGTDINGCSNFSTLTQSVSLCTAVQNSPILIEPLFNIYPNPNNGLFSVDLNQSAKIIITTILGQEIINEQFSAGKQNFDLQNQQSGIYFLKINNSTKKIIIQ